jgi:DNA-binding MarR family transcriptional regulator
MKEIYEIILKLKYFCYCHESRISTSCQISLGELKGIKVMEEEQALTCSDIAKKINLSPSRGSRIIDNLVRKGLLLRKIKENDRRTTLLYLTKKGREVMKNIDREEKKFEHLLTSELGSEDIEIIKKGLKLLERILLDNTQRR